MAKKSKYISQYTGPEIDRGITKANNTYGGSYYDTANNTMLYFNTKEDLQEWISTGDSNLILDSTVMNFTNTIYQVKIDNLMGSKNLYFTTKENKAEITVSFSTQKKGITESSWQDVIEDYNVSIYIDKGTTGSFTPYILDQFVMSGHTYTFDVKKVLATGSNRVRIIATGTESGEQTQGSEMFIVNLTSMYLSPSNFTWYKPFIEGETYTLGGMNIGGNLNKVLKVKMSKEGYERLYEVNIGSNIYTTTAYVFNGMEFPEAGTGVYNVEMWLDANGLESDHLSYNIICVAEADKFTAQLVAIGNPAKTVFNFSDNELFQYCIYNGGTATGTPHIKVAYIVNTNPTTIIDEDLVDVATASPLTYTASLEIEMEDESAALSLETFMTYGNEQMIVYPVDNSKSYPATTGAVFYLNPSARNNAQENREKIVNSINGAQIDATFTRMAWTDGTDGWTTDEEGRKCLRLPAGCTMDLAYQPLASVSQKTIEFVYKVKNAADYDEPIFSICSDVEDPQFRGIKITPKNILLHSRDLNVNDSLQDYNTTDEETLHILVTIIPNYKTNYGNLVQIYCNGDKVRSFSFETADRWDVAANVKVGSETADVFLYKMRVYDRGFESYDALKNYINSLPSTKEKKEAKAKIEAPLDDSYKLSYDECVKNGLNTMVIEILDQDQTVPSIANPSAKQCNLWVKVHNPMDGELDADFARFFSGEMIENQTIEGQGTTAMTYARWNFRWKLGEEYNKRRITAKKNFASSMHSHKMGATRLFNDLHRRIVGANDADARVAVYQYPVYGFQKVLVEGTTDQYVYEPIGLYTIGPDKGDKPTFGYNNKAFKNTLIHMEGTDHTPKGVGFDYPYDELGYSGASEALGAINASGSVVAAWEVGAAGDYDPKDNPTEVKAMLDAEFASAYNIVERNSTYILGVTETLEEINADIADWQSRRDAEDRSFADLEFFTDGVYDLYFYNTRTQRYEARGINMLVDLGLSSDMVNAMSLDEKTELFKTKRRERFVALWENYWDKNDSIFHYTFMLVFGATDNFKKNTYPYKFKAVSEGGKWRWRSDDLDTLFDINNQGLAAKIYSILVGDKTSTGSGSIYRGDTSVFWTLIRECFGIEIKAMVHSIFNAMVEMCPSAYGKNTLEKLVGCIRYYFWDKAQAYFPASAYSKDAEWTYEDTWAAGLYKEVNPLQQSLGGHKEAEIDWVTMRMLFCAMFFNYGPFGAVNDSFSDTSTGQIAYGGAGAKKYLITMACDGNPTILRGQSELVTFGDRVKAGETIELTVPNSSGADTRIYIQGVDWMSDIGDLSDLQVSADNPQLSVASKRLQRLKLGDEDASKVTTNVQALNFGDCPSMMIVDARNAKSLTGSIDLSKMPRLMEAYFGGTGVKAVNVPNGSKIAVLELGEETTQISLMNLKFMDIEGFKYTSLPKLEYLRIENCSQLNPFQMLKSIYNTDGNVIRDIRIIGFDVEGDASDVTMIANLANDLDKDGNPHTYNGIDAEGKPIDNSHPVIEGRLSINGNIYEEDYEALKAVFANLAMEFLGFYVSFKDPEVLRVLLEKITTDDGVGLTIEDIEGVTSIATWFNGNTTIETFDELSRFAKVKVLSTNAFRKCANLKSVSLDNITEVGSGCFYESGLSGDIYAPNALTVKHKSFRGTKITSFVSPTLKTSVGGYFEDYDSQGSFSDCASLRILDVPSLENMTSQFCYACSSLVSVNSPSVKAIDERAFMNATKLESINLENVTTIGSGAFIGCSSLNVDLVLPKLTSLGAKAFRYSGIKSISAPLVTKIVNIHNSFDYDNGTFKQCMQLESVNLPSVVSIEEGSAFSGCTKLREVIVDWENITTIGGSAFNGCTALEFTTLRTPNLTTLSTNAFTGVKIKKWLDMGKITSLTLAGAVKTALEELVVPETVTTVAKDTLNGCVALTSLGDIRWNKLTSVGENGFLNCTLLPLIEEMNLESITSIGGAAFGGVKIKKMILGEGLTTMPVRNAHTYGDGTVLEEITIPSSITSIPQYAFSGYKKLKTIHGAENVTSVGQSFANAESLEYLYFPSIESFGGTNSYNGTFVKAQNLNLTLRLGPNCATIASYLFSYSAKCVVELVVEALTPPSGFGAPFHAAGTSSFKLIAVPAASIADYAAASNWSTYADLLVPLEDYDDGGVVKFADPAVEAICVANWDTNKSGYMSKNECEAVTSLRYIFKGNTNIETFDELKYFTSLNELSGIPEYGAFTECSNLRLITLPDGITSIGSNCFWKCSKLENINLDNVVSLGGKAFAETAISGEFNLPNLVGIGGSALANTNITKLIAPNVTTIGSYGLSECSKLEVVDLEQITTFDQFAFYNCSALKALVCRNATPPTFGSLMLYGTTNQLIIYVPDGAVDAYKEASGWTSFASRIKPLSEYNG